MKTKIVYIPEVGDPVSTPEGVCTLRSIDNNDEAAPLAYWRDYEQKPHWQYVSKLIWDFDSNMWIQKC